MTALLGILQLDRGEPFGFAQVPGLVQAWVIDAGGFAAVGLALYLLYALLTPTDKSESEKLRVPVSMWMIWTAALALVVYAPVVAARVGLFNPPQTMMMGKTPVKVYPPPLPLPAPGSPVVVERPRLHGELIPVLSTVGGLLAILGIGEPFFRDLRKLRWRRISAIAKVGFKEAVRSRLLWVFLVVFIPFLLPAEWFIPIKAADQLRTTVGFVSLVVLFLVLSPAVLLASFSIPNDIKNQTIHTVVTKPVERFEIVLGRFLGYSALMTMVLAGLTAITMLLIGGTKLDPKAEEETAKARVPLRGQLSFKSRKVDFEGTNVGREFEYRKYIGGHQDSPQRAVWAFDKVPSALLAHDPATGGVRVEYTLDIFRMTKGEENKGVNCTFRVVTHDCPQRPPGPNEPSGLWPWADTDARQAAGLAYEDYKREKEAYQAGMVNRDGTRKAPGTVPAEEDKVNPDGARKAPGPEPAAGDPAHRGWKAEAKAWAAANALAEKYGFFEISNVEVYDYEVGGIDIPVGLFKAAAAGDPGKDAAGNPLPRFTLYVKCESGGQLLGMAEPDLYVLERNNRFTQNYIKGMFGVWCRLLIVIGLAVASSTYLSGVLGLLLTVLVYLSGYFTDHLNDLAANRNIGGGPFESMQKLVKAESPTTPSADTAGAKVVQKLDEYWAWVVRRIQNVIPDVESFSWTDFVSEGFNVSIEYLLVNLLVLAGYLLPWAVLSYYLMKSREVAA